MKLCFSTLGCPGWSWDEVLSTAKDLGMQGVEVRGLGEELDARQIDLFGSDRAAQAKVHLDKMGMEISMLASGCTLAHEDADAQLQEAKDNLSIAKKLGVRFVRVMATGRPQATLGDFENACTLYGALCRYGEALGVTPLIETNGLLANTKEMLKFIERVDSPNKGIVWDVHHPARYFFEHPQDTMGRIGKYVKHVQVKDSIIKDGDICYRMMGYGDIPIKEAIALLRAADYAGYVSLEWVKRWEPSLEEPGIVFAHFKHYMSTI